MIQDKPAAYRWVNNKGWFTYGETPHDTIESTALFTHPVDRHSLQTLGKHPSPCAKFCEATAFSIKIRNLEHEVNNRKWTGLTDVERAAVQLEALQKGLTPLEFMQLHEAKLKEKNNAR
jgi:hypothetical protein